MWGRSVPLRLESGTSTAARLAEDAIIISVTETTKGSDMASVGARRTAVRTFLSEEVRAVLPGVATRCEAVVGRHASCWRVRYMIIFNLFQSPQYFNPRPYARGDGLHIHVRT